MSYHVGTGCKLHKENKQRVSKVAAKQCIPYSHVEVEYVCRHETAEEEDSHRVGMNLQQYQLAVSRRGLCASLTSASNYHRPYTAGTRCSLVAALAL